MFLIVIILFVAIVILGISQGRKRALAWRGFSSRFNLRLVSGATSFFSPGVPVPAAWGIFRLFSRGDSRRVPYRARGEYRGHPIEVFDYQYSTGSGKNRQTHFYTPLMVHTPWMLGRIIIRPENFLDKIAAAIGFDDIDLDSHEFNRKFFVKSPDKKYAYDLLHPRSMEYLLSHPRMTVETAEGIFLFYFEGKLDLGKAPSLLDAGVGFVELLPEYLTKPKGA